MNPKPLLVFLLAAAVLLAGWFLWRGSAEPVNLPGGAEAPAVGKSAADAGMAAAAESGGVERPQPSTPDVVRTEAPAAAGEKAAGGAVTAIAVRGRLVDGAKAPRGGVKLELRAFRNLDGIEIDLPVPPAAGRNGDIAAAVTRADGTFDFRLATDRYAFLELPDDLVFAAATRNIRGNQGDQDLGDLVVVRAAMLVGVVQDERGVPVPDVKVSAGLGPLSLGSTSASTTSAEGRFSIGRLRPGKWTLRTASGRFLPVVEEFTLAAEERRADLVLVVKPGQAIAGQVVDDLGRPVAGCKVGSKRKEARGGVDIERFTSDEATVTDAGGYFTLSGLAGEAVSVRAFGVGHTSTTAVNVPVGTGDLLLRVERLAVVEGVLQATDGTPIGGSRIVAEAAAPGRAVPPEGDEIDHGAAFGNGRASAVTGPDGTFRVEGVRPGMVTVSAEGKAHRPARQPAIQVQPAQQVTGVRLLADLGATVRASVVDEAGKPVAGAKVSVERPREAAGGVPGQRFVSRRMETDGDAGEVRFTGDDRGLGSAVSDAAGIASIPGLPSGNVVVRAEHAEFAPGQAVPLVLQKTGVVEATVRMPVPGFADVRVTGPDGSAAAGANFQVTGPIGADERSHTGTADNQGLARVGPLLAGEYTAELRRAAGATRIGDAMFVMGGDGGGAIAATQRRFTVTAGQATTVELRRPLLTKVFGTVTGAGGALAGCIVELEREAEGEQGMPGGNQRSATTGADGSYAIEDVEAGRYELRFGKPEQVVKASVPLEVAANLPELRQDLVVRNGKVRVQAWSKTPGAPIAGAEVEILRVADPGAAAGSSRRTQRVMMFSISMNNDGADEETTMTVGSDHSRTGADGWAEIDDVPAGTYTVRVTHGGHTPVERKEQAVLEQQITDVGRVEMDPAGRIRGKVVSDDGKPVRMAFVSRRQVGGEPGAEPIPAMGGAFTIGALAPGRYLVKAQGMSMGGPAPFGPEVEVEVKAGETATAELRLPAK